MGNVIELTNVTKRFKEFEIKALDLQVKEGFVTGFVGANGAGKSTTIKIMMNLLQPDEGSVRVFGKSYKTHEREIKRQIGFVYDANIYYEGLTLESIRKFIKGAYDTWSDEAFEQYVTYFELPMRRSMRHFSKGMQMKASIALALAHNPRLLIMDEPTAGLDPVARREMLDMLQQLMLDEKRSICFSTHITSDLERIADYIAVIDQGQLQFHLSREEMNDRFAIVKGDVTLLDADVEEMFTGIHRYAHGFEALTNCRTEAEAVLQNDMVIERATLEDIMFFAKREHSHG